MRQKTIKPSFFPDERTEFLGIYHCPRCGYTAKQWLPISAKQLKFAIQFLQNPFLSFAQRPCPICGGHQWLERIISPTQGEVISVKSLLESEIQRLRSSRNLSS